MTRYFLLLVAFSLPAAAQAPVPAPEKPAAAPEKPAATPAAPRRPLILRLDEIDGPKMSFGASEGEKYQPAELPTLGGNARPLEPTSSPRSSPYPHSSENLQ